MTPWTIYSLCNSPGQTTGVGSLSPLQGIFQNQGSNSGLPHCRQGLSHLSHKGSPFYCLSCRFCHLLTPSLPSPSFSEVLVAQSCLTLCNPTDCSPPGSSVHGILQARILEWVAISFSRGSSQLRDQTQVSCIAGKSFTI